jgi:hypothetical protein
MIDDSDKLFYMGQKLSKENNPDEDGALKKYFQSKPYFKRLFPSVKEQKPGVDLYVWITLIQFVICLYLLMYYTDMDTEGT